MDENQEKKDIECSEVVFTSEQIQIIQRIVADTFRKICFGEINPFQDIIPCVYNMPTKEKHKMDEKLLYEIHPNYIAELHSVYDSMPVVTGGHRILTNELPKNATRIQKLLEQKGTVWLQDRIANDYWGWNYPGHPAFIKTPTGSGKTTFIKKVLIPFVLNIGLDITIYVPRETLAAQYVNDIEYELLEQGFQNIQQWMSEKIVIETFQSLEHKLAARRPVRITKYTIVDECHSMLTDAIYNRNCTLSFDFFVNLNFASKMIFMSATGERIFNKLDNCILQVWRRCGLYHVHYLSFWYEAEPDYSYLKIKYLYAGWNVVDVVRSDLDNKWVIFVDNLQTGKKYYDMLKGAGINVAFLHSDRKRQEADTFNSITMLSRFSEQVIISTSVLESGINIRDIKLKNMICTANNKEQFLQMLGRKRLNEEIGDNELHLYLDPKNKKHFETLLRQVVETKRKYDMVTRQGRYTSMEALSQDVVDHYIAGKIDISVFFTSFRYGMWCNELCAEELMYLMETYREIIERFDTEGDAAFLKTQLEWLSLPEEEYSTIKVNEATVSLREIGNMIESKRIELTQREKACMLKKEQTAFLKLLISEVRRLDTEKKYIVGKDSFSVSSFNLFCDENDLPYAIDVKGTSPREYYLKKLEMENEDSISNAKEQEESVTDVKNLNV